MKKKNNPAAVALGRIRSAKKAKAARLNGLKPVRSGSKPRGRPSKAMKIAMSLLDDSPVSKEMKKQAIIARIKSFNNGKPYTDKQLKKAGLIKWKSNILMATIPSLMAKVLAPFTTPKNLK